MVEVGSNFSASARVEAGPEVGPSASKSAADPNRPKVTVPLDWPLAVRALVIACVGDELPPELFGVALDEELEEAEELPPPDEFTAELPLLVVEPPPPPHATATRVRL